MFALRIKDTWGRKSFRLREVRVDVCIALLVNGIISKAKMHALARTDTTHLAHMLAGGLICFHEA